MNSGTEESADARKKQSSDARLGEVTSRAEGVCSRVRRRHYFWSTDRVRLEAILKAYRAELEELSKTDSEPNRWRKSAMALVEKAEEELYRRKIYAGWDYYNAAKRLEVLGLPKEEIRVLGEGVVFEAKDKMADSWKLHIIEAIVARHDSIGDRPENPSPKDLQSAAVEAPAQTESTKPALTGTLLRLAMEVRDESLQNYYWKFHHLRRQLRILGTVLILALAIVVPVLAFQPNVLWDPMSSNRRDLAILACLFGVLGGCLSAFRTYTPKSLQVRIPEMYSTAIITILRPVVGGAAGLVSFAFLASGAVRFQSNIGAVALTIAFATGFSERLILGVVESIGGR